MNRSYYKEIGVEPTYSEKELYRELELHQEEKVDSNLKQLGREVLAP